MIVLGRIRVESKFQSLFRINLGHMVPEPDNTERRMLVAVRQNAAKGGLLTR